MHFYFFTITSLLRYLLCLFLVNLSLSFSSVKFISENLGKKGKNPRNKEVFSLS